MSEETQSQGGVRIFVSYVEEDKGSLLELYRHLHPLRYEGRIAAWGDQLELDVGSATVDPDTADLILLLVSPDYLASEHAYGEMVRQALARHEEGQTHIVPIMVRPADWAGAPFGRLEALPKNQVPVTQWDDRDTAFHDIARSLRVLVEEKTRSGDKAKTLAVRDFSAFEKAEINLCPNLNVLIGANATGKTHLMKLGYMVLSAWAHVRRSGNGRDKMSNVLESRLARLFLPAENQVERLIRHSCKTAELCFTSEKGRLRAQLENTGDVTISELEVPEFPSEALFVPSRETLAMYEGFVSAYDKREISFDETYYDLCIALGHTPLRPDRLEKFRELLGVLEEALGGHVRLRGNRFYVETESTKTEAHLLAEGMRHVAVLAQLVRNGALGQSNVLFWDEPESNLNPRLVRLFADTLVRLTRMGFQVVVTTHDYLLAHELSLQAEYPEETSAPARFFSLYRPEPTSPVQVEHGPTLADLSHNQILEEHAAYHDREMALVQRDIVENGRRGD